MWWFSGSSKSNYAHFENEKTESYKSRNGHLNSSKTKEEPGILKFRNNEMAGEIEPEIFYRNEYSKENTANHREIGLKLGKPIL
jgi:hypothetical protein